jgi:hypothetical protein
MKNITIVIGILLLIGCTTKPELEAFCYDLESLKQQNESSNITFILSEGTFGNIDGSLWGVKDNNIEEITGNPTGNTAQSMAIHNDNLYVVNNASATILKYEISDLGLVKPTCESLDLNGSSPREILVIDDKAYISQWNVYGISVIDLLSFTKTNTIPVDGSTEGLACDGNYLYTSIIYTDYTTFTSGNSVVKINLSSNSVEATYTVGNSPQQLIYNNGSIYVSSTYYDANWNANHATSLINLSIDEVTIVDHENSVFFGNDFSIHNNIIYRAYNKGIVVLNSDLSIDISTYIGTEYNGLCAMAINDDLIYLGFGDYTSPDNVVVLNFDGTEVSNFEVGASPGSFAFWKSE